MTGLTEDSPKYVEKECQHHGRVNFQLRSDKQNPNKTYYYYHCTVCKEEQWRTHNEKRKERQKEIKIKLIALKGGGCQICGYSKCNQALHFHHLDPKQKEFKISKANRKSLPKILEEIEKCILVCANCHAELHWLEEDNNES